MILLRMYLVFPGRVAGQRWQALLPMRHACTPTAPTQGALEEREQAATYACTRVLSCPGALQGAWLGLRAAAAGGRFLQARRHGTRRLGFSNANLGVWEQWEPVAGDPGPPWARLRLSFCNRQLPQVWALAADASNAIVWQSIFSMGCSTAAPPDLMPIGAVVRCRATRG